MSSDSPTKIINLLSGPRNVSTALMYAFAQRTDAAVVDEPLYGHYLRLTQAPQPHWEEMIEILETDGEKVVREVILSPPPGKAVWFLKNMAHHLIDLDFGWLSDPRMVNVFLIRDPVQMLPSLINQIAEPTMRDTAYESQARWFRELDAAGLNPQVLDARSLLLDPEGVLSELCRRIGIEFDPAMLSWPTGPRPEDGPWSKYWYHNLHRSMGFAPYMEKSEPFPERFRPLLEASRPHYEYLLNHAIKQG